MIAPGPTPNTRERLPGLQDFADARCLGLYPVQSSCRLIPKDLRMKPLPIHIIGIRTRGYVCR